MPLSGVLLRVWASMNPQISEISDRLSNNSVENWFDQLNESVKLFLAVMHSEYANVVYELIDAYYQKNTQVKQYNLKNYKYSAKDVKESWSKGRTCSNYRRKGYYNELSESNQINPFDDCFEGILILKFLIQAYILIFR